MLHDDALKVVAALEHLEAIESVDMTADPEYQAFVEVQRKFCRCSDIHAPCDGVLAGGMCDDFQEESERRCFFCSEVECDGECVDD